MNEWKRSLLTGTIVALAPQLYWNVFVSGFRISPAVILLPILLMTIGKKHLHDPDHGDNGGGGIPFPPLSGSQRPLLLPGNGGTAGHQLHFLSLLWTAFFCPCPQQAHCLPTGGCSRRCSSATCCPICWRSVSLKAAARDPFPLHGRISDPGGRFPYPACLSVPGGRKPVPDPVKKGGA